MHLGLNLIYLVPGETGGTETYARGLIPALVKEQPDLRITAFVNEPTAQASGQWTEIVDSVTVPVDARRRSEWVRGEQQLLPRLAGQAGVQLLHSLGNTAPAWGRFRRVVTIHDLIHRLYPETHGRLRASGMAILVPLAARRAHRIIVPSRATRDDLVRILGTPEPKLDVVPMGVDPPPDDVASEAELRERLSLGSRPVALSASAKRPHKNLIRLLDALALIPRERRPILVLPGYVTRHEEHLRAHAADLGVAEDTRFLDWVSQADLEGLYRLASCFVFPSLYEGFGLPVLEAMARGVPVACSNRGSLAEVSGEATRLFDPESPPAIADAIQELIGEQGVADACRAAGLQRVKEFTWAETARSTLRSYEAALECTPASGSFGR